MLRSLARSIGLAAFALLVLAPAVAAGDFRGANTVSIRDGETVDEDLYVGAGTASIAGTVNGDATVAGGTVTVSGTINGSLNVGGGTVDILGEVGGAVRVSGGTVRVAGSVGRDVVVMGGTVSIEPGATVTGDVAGGVGTLTVGGAIDGDLLAAAGTIQLARTSTVGGEVDATTEELVIESGASVAGDVTYTSEAEAEIAAGAEIGGAIERRDPPAGPADSFGAANPILSYLGLLAGLLIFGWTLLWLRPRLVLGSGETLRTAPLLALGVGVGAWIGQWVLLILLIVVGALVAALVGAIGGAFIFAAFVVILLIVIVLILSSVPVAMAIGGALLRGQSAYLAYLAGAAILAAVIVAAGLVPVLGGVLTLVVWILGLGAYTVYGWRTRNRPYGSVEAPPPGPPARPDPIAPGPAPTA